MDGEANNPFTDILSAALDESGITDDFEDFLDQPTEASPQNFIGTQPIVTQPVVPTQQWNGHSLPVNQTFSSALKQLANTSQTQAIRAVRAVPPQQIAVTQPVKPSVQTASPTIVRVPKSAVQVQNVIGHQSSPITVHATTNPTATPTGNTTPRIIKITRVGSQGALKLAQSGGAITLGNLASGSLAGKKIIIKRTVNNTGDGKNQSVPVVSQVQTSTLGQTIPFVHTTKTSAANAPVQVLNISKSDTSLATSSPVQVVSLASDPQMQVLNLNRETNSPLHRTTAESTVHVVGQSGLSGGALVSGQPAVSLLPPRGESLLTNNKSLINQSPLIVSMNSKPEAKNNVINTLTGATNIGGLNNFKFSENLSLLADLGNENKNENGIGTALPATLSLPSIKTNLSHSDLSRLWSNENIKLKQLQGGNSVAKNFPVTIQKPLSMNLPSTFEEDPEEVEEVEELGHAETYSDYMPSKLTVGIKHPDPVVETSSLSSVESFDIWYRLSIPENTIDYGDLSALQLEAIVYACQRHDIILPSGERAGFLIGDGAGVGKGRTVAGCIYENYLLGRKRALWLSVSNDLRVDAERDLRDIGAGRIEVHPLNKFKYAKISSKENGSVKKGVIFATYSSLIGESQSGGKYRTRLKQLLKWCGKDFDGVIVFDECHKAKNLCPTGSSKPTKTGQTVLELQNRLPKARIIYASATGASEPKNMAYMTRLGLWGPGTPFNEFNDFIQAVERRGVGAMELVAMDMKLRGMYIARQLSFKGVTFRIEEIPLPENFVEIYNESVRMWVTARERFQKAAELIDAEQRMKKTMWGQFWSAHQRFFKYLCISAKVNHCVRLARDAVRNGKCVVIGLQSTGEARTLEQLEEMGGELNDFVSTAKGVFQTLVEKHFPAPDRKKTFDIFGLGGYTGFSNNKTSFSNDDKKRKKEMPKTENNKKQKKENTSDSSDSDSDWLKSDTEASDNELNLSSDSDGSDEGDGDDFNPFASDSDSDDDPWLKKKKGASKKKVKVKKNHKKSKKKERDVDEEFDKALAAAGLLNKNNAIKENINSVNNNSTVTNNTHTPVLGMDCVERAVAMKRELLDMLEELGDRLPPNTLDHLIDELGGPENVAEMTGRKGRVVSTDDGISYESRSASDVPLEILNLTEKQRFMDGEKNIAIISEAASSGISLQADKRAINQKRRVHITLELPWSADRAIQQFGRTHRSNQVSAPEYVFMISELAGEQRFASTVAKRLESLGALTHGDRRATETRDLSRFNFDNKYGRAALESVMKSTLAYESPLVPPPSDYGGNFYTDVKKGLVGVGMVTINDRINVPILEKDYNNISKFLNRILGMEVSLQNGLFQYFSDSLTAIILEAKRNGRWDMGILDLGSGSESVKKLETKTFVGNTATNTAKTELTTFTVERGMSWTQAMDIWRKYTGVDDGFYISSQERSMKKTAVLAAYYGTNKKKEKLYNLYRPNTGRQTQPESLSSLKKKYKKVLPDVAQQCWDDQYSLSAKICSHAYWKGNCKKASLGLPCEVGLRSRTFHVLSGSVLSVWSKVESVLASMPGGAHSKMQIIRLKTDSGQRIVGSLIPNNCLQPLCNILSQDCKQTFTETHSQPEDDTHLSMPMFL